MLQTHPSGLGEVDPRLLQVCIDACHECAQACTACADACLGEQTVADLATCIRANLDCADVCYATGTVVSRQTGSDAQVVQAVLESCVLSCRACGHECASHADMHEHCRVCADSCRRCEQACQALLAALQ
jgi:hypothetical protein